MKAEKATNLGRLVSVYGLSPYFLQRAAAVSLLSFAFFLAMMIVFYIRQNIGYFLLATAFLIVNIFTLTGWFLRRRSNLKIYENGFSYKKFVAVWSDIELVETKTGNGKINCEIRKKNGEKISLNESVFELEKALAIIYQKSSAKTVRQPEAS